MKKKYSRKLENIETVGTLIDCLRKNYRKDDAITVLVLQTVPKDQVVREDGYVGGAFTGCVSNSSKQILEIRKKQDEPKKKEP